MDNFSSSDGNELRDANSRRLIEDIKLKLRNGESSEAVLSTDEKVLARLTDGIYRQPSSALRELISNAYDADASSIYIDTDAPKFENITIKDDGNGMSIEILTNLIYHIGGSAKRSTSQSKIELGVTDVNDPTLSPIKKRKLIGKIGIGLFSVAQLTRHFSIVTKQAGMNYYLIANIILNNYSEEIVSDEESRGESFKTGSVTIHTESTENIDAHGTDIILRNIKKGTRDVLKSTDLWLQESRDSTDEKPIKNSRRFHIGCTNIDNNEIVDIPAVLPWRYDDPSEVRFLKLYKEVVNLTAQTVTPKLESDLDNYLNMIWTLGLSVPVDYIETHPFLLTGREYPSIYKLSNRQNGKADKVELPVSSTIKDFLSLETNTESVGFNVYVDGIKIFRPIKFTQLPVTEAVVKEPILFIGAVKPDLKKYDAKITGGSLAFEAYILWCPKVVPKEHNGILIRINNAAGLLFDSTFMKYQVSEYTIRGQLSIEVFVREGLDSALNIDRESFNTAHPHYQLVMRWVHDAIRQVISKYKEIKQEKMKDRNKGNQVVRDDNYSQLINSAAILRDKDPNDIRRVIIQANRNNETDSYFISASDFSSWIDIGRSNTPLEGALKEKIIAIVKVLDAFDLLEGLSEEERKGLFEMLSKVVRVG